MQEAPVWQQISIHALREEGDDPSDFYPYVRLYISIHALREEGDGQVPVRRV